MGSLVRPDELVALLQQGKQPTDAELSEVLDRSVHDVVRQQVEAGVDIVSDGEFGKVYSWSQYVLTRLGGLEFRPAEPGGTNRAIGGKDRRDFAAFYEEYEGALGVAGLGRNSLPAGNWAVVGPLSYTGQRRGAGRHRPAPLGDGGSRRRRWLSARSWHQAR